MPITTNYFKIGAFTLAGAGLFLIGLLVFGLSDSLFKNRLECVTFFDSSVQGLGVESAVKFLGFKVGKVTSISLTSLETEDKKPVVKVSFEIDPKALGGEIDELHEAQDYITQQTKRGLKSFLSFQGVTGIGFLDLDYDEIKQDDNLTISMRQQAASSDLVFVPAGPGQIMEISESVTRIVKSLSDVDFAGMSRDINILVQTADKAVSDLNTGGISEEIELTLNEIRRTASSVNTLATDIDQTIKGGAKTNLGQELQASVQQLKQTLKRLDQLFGSSQGNLPVTLDNLRVMSENFREVSELIKAQPSQMIFGGPPAESKPTIKSKSSGR